MYRSWRDSSGFTVERRPRQPGILRKKSSRLRTSRVRLTSCHEARRGSLARSNKRSIYNLLQISQPFSRRWQIVIDTMWSGPARKPYGLLSPKTTQRLPLLLGSLILVQFLSMEATIPLDAAVYQWLQSARSCHLVHIGMQCKDSPLWYLILFGGLGVCVLGLQRRWTDIAHALLIVLSGAFLSELLKTGLDRARPSALPAWLVGNSFPSGHVIGAVLITGTLIFFLSRKDVPVWLRVWGSGIAICLSGVIIWQRLYLGHHWATDIIGSLLIAGALLSVALRPPAFLQSTRHVPLPGPHLPALLSNVLFFSRRHGCFCRLSGLFRLPHLPSSPLGKKRHRKTSAGIGDGIPKSRLAQSPGLDRATLVLP